jgi:hypothetical protein
MGTLRQKQRTKKVHLRQKQERDYISLKWGTLKYWDLKTEKARAFLSDYLERNPKVNVQDGSEKTKQFVCDLIDACNAKKICLEWEAIDVSKTKAKKYVMEWSQR